MILVSVEGKEVTLINSEIVKYLTNYPGDEKPSGFPRHSNQDGASKGVKRALEEKHGDAGWTFNE